MASAGIDARRQTRAAHHRRASIGPVAHVDDRPGRPRSAFLDWLEQERHAAANTVEAYGHALAGFLGFLTRHLGGEPDLAALAALRAADIRAWLAALANDGLAASSRAQHLSALRGFFRFLDRRHGVDITAMRLVSHRSAATRPAPSADGGSGTRCDRPCWR